jgi:hypothetical protein
MLQESDILQVQAKSVFNNSYFRVHVGRLDVQLADTKKAF